ncbi:MAG: hypothetical protein KAT43_04475 [Nanoarchaeota archaeon]|nr:hypothetical protein [Nanoarchaeota archaeon]
MVENPKSELQGNVVVIGAKRTHNKIRKILSRNSNHFIQHFVSIREAIEKLHERRDINLVYVCGSVLENSGHLDWIRTSLGGVEIVLLNKEEEEVQQQKLLESGDEGALAIFNLSELDSSEENTEVEEKFIEESTRAIQLSIKKQRRSIDNIFILDEDRILRRDVIDGVDIFSSDFWTAERREEYSDGRIPSEIKIVKCDDPGRWAIRTVSYAQHRRVLVDGKSAFFTKILTHPEQAKEEYVAVAMYEADRHLEEKLAAENNGSKPRFPTVKYEGYSRTKSGLFYTLKFRKLPTVDYYFLLYTPYIRKYQTQLGNLDLAIQRVYDKIKKLFKKDTFDPDTLASEIQELTVDYSFLDSTTIREGVDQIVKLFEPADGFLPSLGDLQEPDNANANPIFVKLDADLREMMSNVHNCTGVRDRLIWKCLDGIAENDARWTANKDIIIERLRKLTGNKNAKITHHQEERKKNCGRLERYLKSIFLYRFEHDLLKGGATTKIGADAVDTFSLFSDKVKTTVSEEDLERVSNLFADVMSDKSVFVFTQGDMRLQHIFYDPKTGPEIFDYGRAKEERRGISAIEFLVDHVLNLTDADIGRFLVKYSFRFFRKYREYLAADSSQIPNEGLLAKDGDARKKEFRACFLLGLLYRFRKMGPVARDKIKQYDKQVIYPIEKISSPWPVEVRENGIVKREMNLDKYEDIDPTRRENTDYYSPDYIVDYHIGAIKSTLDGILSQPNNKDFDFLTAEDKKTLTILHRMLEYHEICIESGNQQVKRRISLYDKTCDQYRD